MENEEVAVGPSSRESSFDPPVYNIYHAKDHTLQWHPAVGSKELAVALSYHFPLETSMERKMRAATKKFLKEEKKGKRSGGRSSVESVGLASVAEESAEGATSGQWLSKEPFPELPIEPKNSDLSVNDHNSCIFPVTVSKPKPAHLQETTKSEVAESAVSRPSHEAPHPKILSWVHAGTSKEPKRRKRRYGILEAAEVAANRGNACDDHRKRKVKCNPETCPNNGLRLRTNTANAQAKPSLLSQVLRRLTPDANPKASDTSVRETTRAAPLSNPPQQTQSNAGQLPNPYASGDVHSEKVSLVPGTTKFRPRTSHSGQTQPNLTNDGDTSTATLGSAHATSTQQPDFLPTAHTSALHLAFVDPSSPPSPNLPNYLMAYHVNDVEYSHDVNETSPWFLEDANVIGDWCASSSTPEGLPSFTDLADQGNPPALEDFESVLNAPLGRQRNAPIPDLIQSPIFVDYPPLSEEQHVRLPQLERGPASPPDDLPSRLSLGHFRGSRSPKSLLSPDRTRISELHMETHTPKEPYTQLGRDPNDRRFTEDSTMSTRSFFTRRVEKCTLPDTEALSARDQHTETKSKYSVSARQKSMFNSPPKRPTGKPAARHTVDPNAKGAGSPLLAGKYQDSTSANPGLHASQVQSYLEDFPVYEMVMVRGLEAFDLRDTKHDEI